MNINYRSFVAHLAKTTAGRLLRRFCLHRTATELVQRGWPLIVKFGPIRGKIKTGSGMTSLGDDQSKGEHHFSCATLPNMENQQYCALNDTLEYFADFPIWGDWPASDEPIQSSPEWLHWHYGPQPLTEHSEAPSEDESALDWSTDSDRSAPRKLSRAEFRETIGRKFYADLMSDKYSYKELIDLYQQQYPEYAHKFTLNFCSKMRTGRIMNAMTQQQKRRVSAGDLKMRRIPRVSSKSQYAKMTPVLFETIQRYEAEHPEARTCDIERLFGIHRATYARWKLKHASCDQ